MQTAKVLMLPLALVFILMLNACEQTAEEYFRSGRAKYYQADFEGAMQDFNKAIEIHPGAPAGYSRLLAFPNTV